MVKFSGYIDVNRPIELVSRLFADPSFLGEYQHSFLRKVHTSGNIGQDGAISLMYYSFGKKEMELKETIVSNQLPASFDATYEHIHMDNSMHVRFEELDSNSTRYHYEYEYTRMAWVMPRLIAILYPAMYRKQGEKWLKSFKEFAESYQK